MSSIFKNISGLFKPSPKASSTEKFRKKYQYFQNLLVSNDQVLERMAILSEMLNQKEPFAFGKGRKIIKDVLDDTHHIIDNLQNMCDGRYGLLKSQFDDIYSKENTILFLNSENSKEVDKSSSSTMQDLPYSLDLQQVNAHDVSKVGGKMAHLGEVKNVLGILVPDGMCITSRCFEEFITDNNLREKINDFSRNLDINDAVEIQEVSRAIQAMLVSAPIPTHIEEEILKAYDHLCHKIGKECLVAIRSSAVGEDDLRHSFAGLHYTALNVSRHNIVNACWEVLISKYLPESMVYRFVSGLRDVHMPMNIGCMVMLDPAVSGTLFTVDPRRRNTGMIIQAVLGVGTLVVEGKVVPQEYVVDRSPGAQVLDFSSGNQDYYLQPKESDGLDQIELDSVQSDKQFLTKKQVEFLINYGFKIEAHFGIPQDIEWAITKDGRIYILQARPLQVVDVDKTQSTKKHSLSELKTRYPVNLEGGECACQGVGSGPVFIATQERYLVNFPDGGILVAQRTSPSYARVLHKAAAIVTEIGCTTGHLSIIARELGVPTIINLKEASQKLQNGEYVTVDAFHGVVFAGKIEEVTNGVLNEFEKSKPFHDTPIYEMINQAAEFVLPLNLTDPQADSFQPQNCKTAHDITRFCHEMAILEMFKVYDSQREDFGKVRKLEFSIPLEIYVIDLGGGLKIDSSAKKVSLENVQSVPFKAVLKGMNTPGLPWSGPVPMDLRGFAGLIMNTMVDTGRASREMGSRSYAMISYHYINFSARLGYHFSSLDAYASPSFHRNYISYRFKGGAADTTRRTRRAKFISEVLNQYGFHVVQQGDHVHSTIRKLEESEILKLLTNLGRLLGAIRNADVTMFSEEQIELYAQAFLSGSSSPVETVKKNQQKNLAKGDS